MSGEPQSLTLGLLDAPRMLADPAAVFRRIADNSTYGWAFGTLLLLAALLGWATVQTGLVDTTIDRQTNEVLARMEIEQTDLLSRVELSEQMAKVRQAAEFNRLMARGGSIIAPPVTIGAAVLVIAALLFAVVALAGQKADFPTLVALCVYAAVVDVLAAATRLTAMLIYRTVEVDTTLGLLVPASASASALRLILSGLDPFRVWFWVLIAVGLIVTGQLSRRAAVGTAAAFFLVSAGIRMIPTPGAAPGT